VQNCLQRWTVLLLKVCTYVRACSFFTLFFSSATTAKTKRAWKNKEFWPVDPDPILKQGCQIFVDKIDQNGEKYTKLPLQSFLQTIPNGHKIYQMAEKNISNGHKIHQHLWLQDTPKFTQIWILGLKIYHLATLFWNRITIHSNWFYVCFTPTMNYCIYCLVV
jgi:hypothetical protein